MDEGREGCPRCGSYRVIYGSLKVQGDPFGAVRFFLKTEVVGNTLPGWLFNAKVEFDVPKHLQLCVGCGLLWNLLDPDSIQQILKTYAKGEDLDRLGLIGKNEATDR